MRKLVRVTVNGQAFSAYPGDVLLDAALMSGVGLPHDCRSGSCGTCKVRVVSGRTLGGESLEPGMVHACQARALTDVEIATDLVPEVEARSGRLVGLNPLTEDVVEAVIEPAQPLSMLPGQYVQVQFAGFPSRAFSPTAALDARPPDGRLRFHIRRLPDGRVSGELGRSIVTGHRVKVRGPFGSAYLRHGEQNRLVLVCGGTGFAPIWSIADAALSERYDRPMLVLVGARSLASMYMVQALDLMAICPGVRVIVTCEQRQQVTGVILPGRPTDYLPPLLSRDVVYAAGPPQLVNAVSEAAAVSRAACYADPFVPSGDDGGSWLGRVLSWRGRDRHAGGAASGPLGPPPLPANFEGNAQAGAPHLHAEPGLTAR